MGESARPGATRMAPAVAGNLYRQWSDLIDGGLTPAEAVAVLQEDAESGALGKMLGEMGGDLAQGLSVAQAMQRHAVFGPETVAFIAGAEGENSLAGAFATLADDCERRQHLRVGLPLPLLWPLFLLGLLFVVVSLLMIFVIPSFKQVFASFGADLPGPTLVVIALSDLLAAYGWIAAVLVIAVVLGIAALRRRPGVGAAIDRWPLVIPGMRRTLTAPLASRLAALLAGASANRIPFVTAVAYLRSTLCNQHLRELLAGLGRDVEQGMPLAEAWRRQPSLPRRVARMIDIGERSGRLAVVLERAARMHGAEGIKAIAVFRQALFVTTYILTGVIVGLMVIAMYLPIFAMGSLS